MNRRVLFVTAFAALGATACSEERAIFTEPVGDAAYGFQLQQTATNLPRGSVRFLTTGAESVTVTISGLDTLTTGFYTAWLGDSLGTTFKRVTGSLRATRQDSTLDALGNVAPVGGSTAPTPVVIELGNFSAMQNGNPRTTFRWAFTRAGSGLVAGDLMQHFVITIEDNATATTPSASRRPIWARRGDAALSAGARTPALKFGNYAPSVLDEYVFSGTPARGRGYFRGATLTVNDSTLARPPIGYYYAFFAMGAFYPQPGAPASDTIFIGDQTSPWPRRELSHFSADSMISDPLVVVDRPRSIIAGSQRIAAADAGRAGEHPWANLEQVWLMVKPKAGPRGVAGTARILRGTVPFVIFSGQQ